MQQRCCVRTLCAQRLVRAPAADLQQLEAEHVGERVGQHLRLELEHGAAERRFEPGVADGVVHQGSIADQVVEGRDSLQKTCDIFWIFPPRHGLIRAPGLMPAKATGVGDARSEPGAGFLGQLPLADPRAGRRAAAAVVVDPGDARAGRGRARAAGAHPARHPRHASPCRPRRRRPGTGREARRRGVRPGARAHALRVSTARRRGHRQPCRPRPRISRDGGARAHPRPRRLPRPRRAVLRRHAVQRRLRPALRGHAGADARFARPHRGAARRHRASTAPTNTRCPTCASPQPSSPATPTCSRPSTTVRALRGPRRHHPADDARPRAPHQSLPALPGACGSCRGRGARRHPAARARPTCSP